jgi:hypothetical protein
MEGRRLKWLLLFAVAMGYLEAAVVVYLRAIYYPDGFAFPLVPIPLEDALIEMGREAATLAILLAAASLAGKNCTQRFAHFLIVFAVWDLNYYLWLKVILDWPASLLTWDILFLIPLPWTGPVLAPVLVSLFWLILAVLLLQKEQQGRPFPLTRSAAFLSLAGALLLLASFLWNAGSVLREELPARYPWEVFALGMACWLGAVAMALFPHTLSLERRGQG